MENAGKNANDGRGCQKSRVLGLLSLFGVFFKIGAVTFGGGLAMLPILNNELAEKRGWTTNEDLLDYYAIGQSTPGIIAVNVATFIGYNRLGILGGIVATLGIVTPSVIIISVLAKFIGNFSEIALVQKALAGINVAVAAMLTQSVWTFAKKSVKNIWSFFVLLAAFAAIYFFKVSSIWVIIASAALGIALQSRQLFFQNSPKNATGNSAEVAKTGNIIIEEKTKSEICGKTENQFSTKTEDKIQAKNQLAHETENHAGTASKSAGGGKK